MAYNAYDELVTGNPKILYYWTLDETLNASVGGINLTGTTTYDTGKAHAKCATFNGTNQAIQSASALSLSAYNQLTLALWWKPIVYDLANIEVMIETSPTFAGNVGTLAIFTPGETTNDSVQVLCKGDVGITYKGYYNSTYSWTAGTWYFLTATYDFTQAGDSEVTLYLNGAVIAHDFVSSNNNTGNFTNQVLSIGARNAASFWHNGAVDGVAIFSGVLTQTEVERLYGVVAGTMPAPIRSCIDLQPILKVG